jgi:DNA polymerase-4
VARTILHFDLDAFFCSVEELLDPTLIGRAHVVAGRPEARGVVSSASYAARRYGVRSAMPTAQALRLCPELVVVLPRHGVYGEHSERVMELVRGSVPSMEQISVDEAFLDVTDHPRPGEAVAAQLQSEIDARFGLPTSWGVAENKLLAKIATNVGKPSGLVVVPPSEGSAFLAPLPVAMLWGVGPKTQSALGRLGIRTIGDLAGIAVGQLERVVGERAGDLVARARGVDDSPVVDEAREARSISNETTFARDVSDPDALLRTLRRLAEQVGQRARAQALAGTTVRLKLRWADFTTITRQTTLPQPSDQDGEIFNAIRVLFGRAWEPGRSVRLVGVGISGLRESVRQLSLFDHSWEEDAKLMRAVDAIRARYGRQALKRLSDLKSREPPSNDGRG